MTVIFVVVVPTLGVLSFFLTVGMNCFASLLNFAVFGGLMAPYRYGIIKLTINIPKMTN